MGPKKKTGMCDPVIDEHFRRSLGERYTHLFASSPSSTSSATSNPSAGHDSSSRGADSTTNNKISPSTVNVTGLSGMQIAWTSCVCHLFPLPASNAYSLFVFVLCLHSGRSFCQGARWNLAQIAKRDERKGGQQWLPTGFSFTIIGPKTGTPSHLKLNSHHQEVDVFKQTIPQKKIN